MKSDLCSSPLQFQGHCSFQRGLPFYGPINWSLAQVLQPSFLGLSQSSTSMRGGKARNKAGFQFNVQKPPLSISSGGCWQRNLTWNLSLRVFRIAGVHVVIHLTVSPILRRRGTIQDGIPDMVPSTTSSTSSSSIVQLGTLPWFWISGEALLLKGLCLSVHHSPAHSFFSIHPTFPPLCQL